MRRSAAMLVLVLAAARGAAFAASQESPPVITGASLTLSAAEDVALATDYRVLTARAAVKSALGQKRAAATPRDPEARIGYAETRGIRGAVLPGDASWDESTYALRLFPPHPGAARAEVHAAAFRVRAAEAAVQLAEWLVTCEVRRLYCEIRHLRENLAAAERLVEARRIQHEILREQARGGAATALDVTAGGLTHLNALKNREETRQLLIEATGRLGAILGGTDLASMDLPDVIVGAGGDAAGLVFEDLAERALRQRAEVGVAAWRMSAAEADLSAARRGRIPWPTHVEVAYSQESGYQDDETWGVGAALDLPIFSALAGGAVAELTGEKERLREELVAARAWVRQEVGQALASWRAAAQRLVQFEVEAGPILQEMRAAQEGLAGSADAGDDLRAGLAEKVASAELSLLDARYARDLAWLRLEEVVGTDLLPSGPAR